MRVSFVEFLSDLPKAQCIQYFVKSKHVIAKYYHLLNALISSEVGRFLKTPHLQRRDFVYFIIVCSIYLILFIVLVLSQSFLTALHMGADPQIWGPPNLTDSNQCNLWEYYIELVFRHHLGCFRKTINHLIIVFLRLDSSQNTW